MEIKRVGDGIVISGVIFKHGNLDDTYTRFDIGCPHNEHDMELKYRLARDGHVGGLTLNMSQVDFGDVFIDGRYSEAGTGDQGRIRL